MRFYITRQQVTKAFHELMGSDMSGYIFQADPVDAIDMPASPGALAEADVRFIKALNEERNKLMVRTIGSERRVEETEKVLAAMQLDLDNTRSELQALQAMTGKRAVPFSIEIPIPAEIPPDGVIHVNLGCTASTPCRRCTRCHIADETQ